MMAVVPVTMLHFADLGLPATEEWSQKITHGIGFALIVDEKTVAAGGIVKDPRQGVGRAWTFLDEARRSPLLMRRIHGYVCDLLPKVVGELQLERLEADCLDIDSYKLWIWRLGFNFEGTSPKYMNGHTYARYAWIRPD